MGDSQPNAAAGPVDDAHAAFAALMRSVPGMRALLLRMTRDVEATKDLAQEVTLTVWKTIHQGRLRDPVALPAYVLMCAKNAAIAHTRKPPMPTVDTPPEGETAWTQRVLTPLEHCEASELRVLARQVMTELPTDRDREIIRGTYFEGRAKPELMHALGLAPIAFDRVISRARIRMRELLRNKLESGAGQVRGSRLSGVPSCIDPESAQ